MNSRRGVIEGYYGRPWTIPQRERIIELLGNWNLDTFLCSPKDQPNHRIYWQEPLSESALNHLKNLVAVGRSVGVDVGTSLSPGLTLEYSNEDHLESQLHRLTQLNEIGCQLVGIFLDDIPGELQSDQDLNRFGSIVEAQLYFINNLCARARSIGITMDFIICPTQYCGIGTEEYISKFGLGLDVNVDVMWTGRQICSTTLTFADAEIFEENTSHLPFYWDNYPVNDVAMTYQLHIGPLRGREPAMTTNMAGYLANPMELFESSLIPLHTMAEFFADPATYDPDQAWDKAVNTLFTIEYERLSFHHFGRTVQDSCLNGDASPEVSKILNRAAYLWRTGEAIEAADVLDQLSAEIATHSKNLLAPTFTLSNLQAEILPWVHKYALGGEVIGSLAHALRENPDFSDVAINQQMALGLSAKLQELHSNRYRVFGDHLEMLLKDLVEELHWAIERIKN
jgi:hyaluronoglucosaminidase